MTKLFEKYKQLLNQSVLTENEIISLKSRISTNPCSLTQDEVNELTNQVTYKIGFSGQLRCKYNITSSHAQKGLHYLKAKCLKANGQRRNTKQLQNMPNEFFKAIKEHSHFTFVGFTEIEYNVYNNRPFYMPVWRIHTRSGEYFDYYMEIGLEFNWLDYNISENTHKLTPITASEAIL